MSELKMIQKYIDMSPQDYISMRVEDQIKWMDAKSTSSKNSYQRLKFLVIILSVSIPFLVLFVDSFFYVKYAIGFVGLLIAAIEGMLSLYEYQNNWVNYRQTLEALRREQFLYATKSGVYKNDNSFSLFVERFESLLATENKSWTEFAGSKVDLNK